MHRMLLGSALVLFAGCEGHMALPPVAPSTSASAVAHETTLTMTFTADRSCADLPTDARSRTYSGVAESSLITLTGGGLSEPAFGSYGWNVVYSKWFEEFAELWFHDPPIWESLRADGYVLIYGNAAGTISPQTSQWPFWGRFSYCAKAEPDGYPECAVPEVICESTHHTLTLDRH
jgi:hypothetical protein